MIAVLFLSLFIGCIMALFLTHMEKMRRRKLRRQFKAQYDAYINGKS